MPRLQTSTGSIHYAVDGQAGDPVLLLSGSLGSNLTLWDRVLPLLLPARTVVRYDLRGHGHSATPVGEWTTADLVADMAALLDELGVERADIGGISLGGQASLAFALRHPERTGALIVADSAPRLGSVESWTERAALVAASGLAAIADQVIDGWLTPAHAAAHPQVRAELRAAFLRNDPAGYAGCCLVLAHSDLRPHLGAVRAPTLVLSGSADRTTPPEVGRALADAVGGAFTELPGAHLTCVESPAEFAAAVLGHLG